MLVSSFNLLESFNYTPYLFKKNGSNHISFLSLYGPWGKKRQPMDTAPNALDRRKIVSDFQYIYPLWSLTKINKANFLRDYNIYSNHVNIYILINNVQTLVHNANCSLLFCCLLSTEASGKLIIY